MDRLRSQIAQAAARLLAELLAGPAPSGPVQVEVSVTDGTLSVRVEVTAGSGRKQQQDSGRLTAVDRRILAAASAEEQTITRLANLADHDPDSYFRERVRRLVGLGLLVTEFGGYRLP